MANETESFEDQAKGLIAESFQDGAPSDGGMTADEQAAVAAETARETGSTPPKAAAEEEAPEGEEEGESADEEAAEGEEGQEPPPVPPKEGEQASEPKPKPGKKSVSERIADMTAKQRTAERNAETERQARIAAEQELADLKSGKKPLTVAQSDDKGVVVAPDPADFDYGELDPKYIAALARHETVQALKEQRAKDDETRQAEAADAKRQEQANKQDALAVAGSKLHDDFDEVVMQGARSGAWPLSQTLGELIVDSEFGPQIAYALAKDPAEAERVFNLSPGKQAAYFGHQEAKFEEAKPSQRKAPAVSQVPPPPKTPKGGSGSTKVDPSSENFADVESAWNSGGFR